MSSRGAASLRAVGDEDDTTRKLLSLYRQHVRPLEEMYSFDLFTPSWFESTLANPRPFVTFFGPWSSGKSTFINYLLQDNYLWTGPQPTTSDFTVVVHGNETGPLDGRVLVSAKNMPFKGLHELGESFLENFKGFQVSHPLLEKVTLIDTPGILETSGEGQQRHYDYVKACRWFIERSDLVFVLFDPTKLDAGSELKATFTKAFKGCEGKLRIILNKADTVDTQSLMRVYGSLFWNLANVIRTTEPPRVYIGSFWDQPYRAGTFTLLFTEEKMDLLHELIEIIPQQARDRKIAMLIRRAKEVLRHAAVVGGIKASLPMLFGKGNAKRKAMEKLPSRYEVVAAKYGLNHRDFPPVGQYRVFFDKIDMEKFHDIEKAEKRGLIAGIRACIDVTLPGMLRPIKHYSLADIRNGQEQDDLKRRYYDAARGQYEGRQGILGSTDIVASAARPAAIERNTLVPYSPPQQLQEHHQQQRQVTGMPDAMVAQMQMMCQHMMTSAQQQQQQTVLHRPSIPCVDGHGISGSPAFESVPAAAATTLDRSGGTPSIHADPTPLAPYRSFSPPPSPFSSNAFHATSNNGKGNGQESASGSLPLPDLLVFGEGNQGWTREEVEGQQFGNDDKYFYDDDEDEDARTEPTTMIVGGRHADSIGGGGGRESSNTAPARTAAVDFSGIQAPSKQL